MPLIKIAGETAASVVYVNPDHVTTLMQRSDNQDGLTRIKTDTRFSHAFDLGSTALPDVRHIWTCTPLPALVDAFGPMVRIKLGQVVTANPWQVAFVRLSAIVSIDASGTRANVHLTSGEMLIAEDSSDLESAFRRAHLAF